MADVRRNEETVRFRLDQRLLHPVRRGAPDRESPVAVVVREHHQEGLLLSYEEGGRPVAEALARLAQRGPSPVVSHRKLRDSCFPSSYRDQGGRPVTVSPAPADARERLEQALFEIRRVIAGQDAMLERVLVCLLAQGHLLIEGVPGLAKTLTIKTTAGVLGGTFSRVQFTPDLVPSDLVGTRIYRPGEGEFDTELGPVFCNFLLADEINRAPAKVQSALLEVMQERQVTIGHTTYPVPDPFLVMATQNPIESEGTYPLPEAQIDRFMLKVLIDYPAHDEELTIVQRQLVDAPELREAPRSDQPRAGFARPGAHARPRLCACRGPACARQGRAPSPPRTDVPGAG